MTRPFAEVMGRKRAPRLAVAIWLAAGSADLGMTVAFIACGAAREAWPPSALALSLGGYLGLAAWKVGLMALTPLATRIQPTQTWYARAWWLAALGTLAPVIWNVWQLFAPPLF